MGSLPLPQVAAGLTGALVAALVLTPVILLIARRLSLFDRPGSETRKAHARPTPRLGGLALFLALALGLMASRYWTAVGVGEGERLVVILFGALLFFLLGLADDLFSLPAGVKLFFQFLIALGVAGLGVRIEGLFGVPIEPGVAVALTSVWIVGIVNTINFIDGLDGLAAGVGAIAAASFGVIALSSGQPLPALISACLLGALVGFLPYNFFPARIFLGDSGALAVGFLLAAVSIVGVYKTVTLAVLPIPILILMLPIFDTLFAIVRRLMEGRSPADPDLGHFHHRLLRLLGRRYLGLNGAGGETSPNHLMASPAHRTAVLILWLLTAAAATLASWWGMG